MQALLIRPFTTTLARRAISSLALPAHTKVSSHVLHHLSKEEAVNTTLYPSPKRPRRTYPPIKEQCRKWVNSHSKKFKPIAEKFIQSINHVPWQTFEDSLVRSVNDFNNYLSSLPKAARSYMIVVPGTEIKSNLWVTRLALPLLRHPLQDILMCSDPRFETALNNKNIQHLLIFDDASYSGDQFGNTYLPEIAENTHMTIHPIIPYMTPVANKLIQERLKQHKQPYRIAIHKTMSILFDSLSKEEQILLEEGGSFQFQTRYASNLTPTYFDHNVADWMSAPDCLRSGKLLEKSALRIHFLPKITPPYKTEGR